jgi:S-adenosyl-L-methionine hydrolase (adenosine-forming)
MRQIVSIISDWNHNDYYLAALKHSILRYLPDANISEISHQVDAFNNMQAAFILRAAWPYFPANSIHLMCVNAAVSSNTPHVLILHKKQFFIGADNGFWPFICNETPEKAWLINDNPAYEGNSFPELNVFAKITAAVGKGIHPEELGAPDHKVQENTELIPVVKTRSIHASLLYFDSYGNGISNLCKQDFDKYVGNKKFRILLLSEKNMLHKIHKAYAEVRPGSLCALFNNQGLLEIAIREGNLKQLLNLQTGDSLRIEFMSPV